jgi:hypothetical protein
MKGGDKCVFAFWRSVAVLCLACAFVGAGERSNLPYPGGAGRASSEVGAEMALLSMVFAAGAVGGAVDSGEQSQRVQSASCLATGFGCLCPEQSYG